MRIADQKVPKSERFPYLESILQMNEEFCEIPFLDFIVIIYVLVLLRFYIIFWEFMLIYLNLDFN